MHKAAGNRANVACSSHLSGFNVVMVIVRRMKLLILLSGGQKRFTYFTSAYLEGFAKTVVQNQGTRTSFIFNTFLQCNYFNASLWSSRSFNQSDYEGQYLWNSDMILLIIMNFLEQQTRTWLKRLMFLNLHVVATNCMNDNSLSLLSFTIFIWLLLTFGSQL